MNTPHLYLLSGVATSIDFMQPLNYSLNERYNRVGLEAVFHCLHPYGTWERRLIYQLNEARQDISSKAIHSMASTRGRMLAESIMEGGRDQDTVLIGHSAGGIAALHIASILSYNGFRVPLIVQIGCPKHTIPIAFRACTLYAYAIHAFNNRPSDPIIRIGTWGSWDRGIYGWPVWNSRRNAPKHIRSIPLIGGHADYFRANHPFLDDRGISNLDRTTDVVWDFINPIK